MNFGNKRIIILCQVIKHFYGIVFFWCRSFHLLSHWCSTLIRSTKTTVKESLPFSYSRSIGFIAPTRWTSWRDLRFSLLLLSFATSVVNLPNFSFSLSISVVTFHLTWCLMEILFSVLLLFKANLRSIRMIYWLEVICLFLCLLNIWKGRLSSHGNDIIFLALQFSGWLIFSLEIMFVW